MGLRDVRYGYEGDNHVKPTSERYLPKDESNPYFTYDPSKCIVCNRCVRACEETQGTFALTIQGRGFDSRVAAGPTNFMQSECVSCGACVQACPTATLQEKTVHQYGQPTIRAVTTCAYCGVGCAFKAEMQGDKVVRMVPYKGGKANEGHSCVKGRFAYGYATHKDRITKPMIREKITDPCARSPGRRRSTTRPASSSASRPKYGAGFRRRHHLVARCTNEEAYLVQKLVRAAFGNNNVDTCARVCHSPTGYGLMSTLGTSAGTQDFKSVEESDVILVIGANPTDGHPVFGSRMKKRIREGAKLIVADPRKIDLVKSPHVKADYHLPLKPGSNVAFVNAFAHVIVTEGLIAEDYVRERCDLAEFESWAAHHRRGAQLARGRPGHHRRRSAGDPRGRPPLRHRGRAAIYYGLGVTEHSQGSTMVMGMANLAMATGNIGMVGAGVNPLRGQNNVQGSCDMGSFPHELPGYRHVSDDATRESFEAIWGAKLDNAPGLRITNMLDEAVSGTFKGMYIQGEDIAQSDPDTHHVTSGLRAMECIVIQDLFLNETAKYAHVFLPGASFLEKDGTFTNAERRISRVRKVMAPMGGYGDWRARCCSPTRSATRWSTPIPPRSWTRSPR